MKKTPPPRRDVFVHGMWVELTKSDRSHPCAYNGQKAQVVKYLGQGRYRLILKCGHLYETANVRKSDEPTTGPAKAPEMRDLRVGRGRRRRASK